MNSQEHLYTNHLIWESSPYLLQHAHNPVDWFPWGEEALGKALAENKLLIISVGYAACHWCHVMEKESFEDTGVADLMNKYFVSIKVDREERPDIDQIYLNAVQLITRQGGWPLNCIALPDGRPLYGGTYFPKKQWMEMLTAVLKFVQQHPEKAEESANLLRQGINTPELDFFHHQDLEFSLKDLDSIYNYWRPGFDPVNGGMEGAPKFPMPNSYQFLLFYYYLSKNEHAIMEVMNTLDKMADGGINDQIGGGFSRYSTDLHWKVPHFEKMLYDNAQLVSLYSEAYQCCKKEKYKSVVFDTLEFIKRELTSPEGCFYSSLDADSEGVEGKYYVWTAKEIEQIAGKDASLVKDYYNLTSEGNWEYPYNILYKKNSHKEIASKHGQTEDELREKIRLIKEALLEKRAERVRPMLDDKVITSWNSLMIKGYVEAYRVFDQQEYLEVAIKCAEFILGKMKTEDHKLFRNYKNDKASINGFLDDYAFTISALISLYGGTFNEDWLIQAKDLTDVAIAHFYDQKSGMFYYTSDQDPSLIARKMEISDNVMPSSNSEMAKNLFVIGHYFDKEDYRSKALRMLSLIKPNLPEGGIYFSNWDILLAWNVVQPFEVAIVGEECEIKQKEFDQHYLPAVFFYGSKSEGSLPLLRGKLKPGQTTIYVCRNKICQWPVTQTSEALTQIQPSKQNHTNSAL